MKYTVARLMEALKEYPPEAEVVMCMDWTMIDDDNLRPSHAQWEDSLGDIACAGPTAKHVYLLNENFK